MVGYVIDGLQFARDGRTAQGVLSMAALVRLQDVALDCPGGLAWQVIGSKDRGGSFLQLHLSGELTLECQRCLRPLAWPVAIERRLRLIPPGQPWPEEELEDDSADAVEAESEMDLLSLVEEELLLGMPIAPLHETCDSPLTAGLDKDASPFAVLAKLK